VLEIAEDLDGSLRISKIRKIAEDLDGSLRTSKIRKIAEDLDGSLRISKIRKIDEDLDDALCAICAILCAVSARTESTLFLGHLCTLCLELFCALCLENLCALFLVSLRTSSWTSSRMHPLHRLLLVCVEALQVYLARYPSRKQARNKGFFM